MGDRMTPIPFHKLMEWVFEEKKNSHRVFGVRDPFVKRNRNVLRIFGESIETPFGPAAGPNTQLAQNIIAAYYSGCRFFELKTVQILDGEDLPVNKPCILAEDEGYNCEWSTELYVPEALEEYVKAWIALKVLSKEFGLGAEDGFVFNMSVGYDLKGIQSEKINNFIDHIMEAKDTSIWRECINYLLDHVNEFKNIDKEYINSISSKVCRSITVSTLHGCPPEEIESIASYLLDVKQLNTYVKCNPTLLGYETARKILDQMGYDYVAFGEFHFKDDLQFEDAVPMLCRLQDKANRLGLEFGVKLTNTFPVDVMHEELPSEEMYMSGRSLCALSLSVAQKLAKAFDGKLRISFSGGADYFNIDKIYNLGIWPITMATTFLKTGGYQRGKQIAEKMEELEYKDFSGVDVKGLERLIEEIKVDSHHTKSAKPLPLRKMNKKVPLLSCFTAPCSEGCPIHQDIPAYLKLVKDGDYSKALEVITDKNALPFITGTICSHTCMNKCTRNFYEESVHIRNAKLIAAQKGYDQLYKDLKASDQHKNKKVAIVGAGPAGIACAFFLAREGAQVTVYEKRAKAGGVVRYVIPAFRISEEAIDQDVELAVKLGVNFIYNHEIKSLSELKAAGYDALVLAVGATKSISIGIESENEINAIEFLDACKNAPETVSLGRNVVVIGAGNTAMDVARAAKRMPGVKKVSIVYRRTIRYMPADEEELSMAVKDGVEVKVLLAPESHKKGKLLCHKVVLGDMDTSGRQEPIVTKEEVMIDADTVIASLGEKVDGAFYEGLGLSLTERGQVFIHRETMESSQAGVYVIGDGAKGAATVVEAIRDASLAANAILNLAPRKAIELVSNQDKIRDKKGILVHAKEAKEEANRCLECNQVCEACVEVCPNRANISIKVKQSPMPQILHVDYMCNECGNCKSFCPYDSSPYKEKVTLYHNIADFENSTNEGFVLLDANKLKYRVRFSNMVKDVDIKNCDLDEGIKNLILAVYEDYRYLMMTV